MSKYERWNLVITAVGVLISIIIMARLFHVDKQIDKAERERELM